MSEFEQTIVNFRRWEVSLRSGKKAMENGDLQKAEKHYLTALDEANKLHADDPRLATINCSLAEVFTKKGELDKAEDYFKSAIDIWEKTLGTDYEGLINVYDKYAEILDKMERPEQALAKRKKSRQIEESQKKYQKMR